MKNTIALHVQPLSLPLRTTFKQASSVRSFGESVWCELSRNGIAGYGEGCPRTYVTGENMESAIAWLSMMKGALETECRSLDSLREWMAENRKEIDSHPAAFCAVETALLDFFSKEKKCSVEKLLGLGSPIGKYVYTGVLGDSSEEKFRSRMQRYLAAGIKDFKVKVNGDIAVDQNKLDLLQQLCEDGGVPDIRIRMDANNLWKGRPEQAIAHLSALRQPLFGIEEPVEPKNYPVLGRISNALDLPIILDESLCSLDDLSLLDKVPGKFIGNIKVSRMGGVTRSLEMVAALKKRGHQVIVGAHVGETSILTRAAMCVANAAGSHLAAQEGGYGLMLLQEEPVWPSLMFGKGGAIDLGRPYPAKTVDGVVALPVENWAEGWGLKCQTPSAGE